MCGPQPKNWVPTSLHPAPPPPNLRPPLAKVLKSLHSPPPPPPPPPSRRRRSRRPPRQSRRHRPPRPPPESGKQAKPKRTAADESRQRRPATIMSRISLPSTGPWRTGCVPAPARRRQCHLGISRDHLRHLAHRKGNGAVKIVGAQVGHHLPANIADLPVGQNAFQPVAHFDPAFVVVHCQQDQHAAMSSPLRPIFHLSSSGLANSAGSSPSSVRTVTTAICALACEWSNWAQMRSSRATASGDSTWAKSLT